MEIKPTLNPKDYEVGVLICRFQVSELHTGHIELVDFVLGQHKKVIIFLGIAKGTSRKNPLDFATRKAMLQKRYPNVVILPINDQRSNKIWSKVLDEKCREPFGEKKIVLYGSRDSFIPFYCGKFPTIELSPSVDMNATAIREEDSKEILDSVDFRKGIIHSVYAQRAVTFPTVDIVVANDKGEILLAKKPNETLYRFVGGFVDTTDESLEAAARRELNEETGGNLEVGRNLRYILSHKVNDWRYANQESGIMTSLFLGHYSWGMAQASDDIEDVMWIKANVFSNYDGVRTKIMPEHREMMTAFIKKVYEENLIPSIGPKLEEVENITYHNE